MRCAARPLASERRPAAAALTRRASSAPETTLATTLSLGEGHVEGQWRLVEIDEQMCNLPSAVSGQAFMGALT